MGAPQTPARASPSVHPGFQGTHGLERDTLTSTLLDDSAMSWATRMRKSCTYEVLGRGFPLPGEARGGPGGYKRVGGAYGHHGPSRADCYPSDFPLPVVPTQPTPRSARIRILPPVVEADGVSPEQLWWVGVWEAKLRCVLRSLIRSQADVVGCVY